MWSRCLGTVYVSKQVWPGYLRVMIAQQRPHPCGGAQGRADTPRTPQTATFMRCLCSCCPVCLPACLPVCQSVSLYRATGFFLWPKTPKPGTLYWPARPWPTGYPPGPVSSCTRYFAAPRGMQHAACGMRHGATSGTTVQGNWLSPLQLQNKKEHAASLFAQDMTAVGNAEGA